MNEAQASGHRLEELAFLQGLSPEYIAQVAAVASPVHWPADEVIYREGDAGAAVYLIDVGRVAIEMTVPGRGRTTVLTIGPGEVLGWSSLFHDGPKDAAARAVIDTHAWALDAPRLRALCDADAQFGYAFTRRMLKEVSQRLKATRMQLLDVFAPPGQADPRTPGGR